MDGGAGDVGIAGKVADRIIIVFAAESVDDKGFRAVAAGDISIELGDGEAAGVATDFAAVIGGEVAVVGFLPGDVRV